MRNLWLNIHIYITRRFQQTQNAPSQISVVMKAERKWSGGGSGCGAKWDEQKTVIIIALARFYCRFRFVMYSNRLACILAKLRTCNVGRPIKTIPISYYKLPGCGTSFYVISRIGYFHIYWGNK